MNPTLIFWLVFSLVSSAIIYCDYKFGMLRDSSIATPKPFSYSRVQLAWWTVIVFSSIISILFLHKGMPAIYNSTLYLLGISSATSAAARMIDVSDQVNSSSLRHQDSSAGVNFFIDILSDENGISIHRFQTVLFNLLFGGWFIYNVIYNISLQNIDNIIPDIQPNYLVLLTLSSVTYTAVKTSENRHKVSNDEPEFISESAGKETNVAQG
ncbi:MAG: hypothetical protein KGJ07_06940 [Patescibacteria group bacterium]|nr:hypothetical protein [Patescibacteria group bacterium]